MAVLSQKKAAKDFAAKWKGKGYEKGESQSFWIELLQKVLQVDDPFSIISFENRVKLSNTSFIDAYIRPTHVLIEQKSIEKDLRSPIPQSDGTTLTPFKQAKRYASELPYSDRPRWIVICNFQEFNVYDMEIPQGEPEVIYLKDLEKEFDRLSFLVDDSNAHIKKELEVSIKAGEIVGVLYDKLLAQYRDPENHESQKSLNKLCVRLVFCLYAEDAGLFGTKNMFHDYLSQFRAGEFREKLIKLFRTLDTLPEDRDPYEDEKLLAFPYVNGGMFSGEIEIPRITEEIRDLILQRASDDFDWSQISPTIFGAVFESTLNPETRRAGGMHYTSIENIHKVIDPLFLDDLKADLAGIKAEKVAKTKREKAIAYQNKLASLKFLDPACGSGNFLTESYTSLRRLENDTLRIIYGADRVIGELDNPIKVSIDQFYGIEINDFACAVAQTALWIAESQMMRETDEIVGFDLDPLPLKTYTNIHEGNALRIDWNEVIPASELDYIMGNPPFVANSGRTSAESSHSKAMLNEDQKKDKEALFGKDGGLLDYVACWFKKASVFIQGTHVHVAFVSTNSICQGQQVAPLWKSLLKDHIVINFAYESFKWGSEAINNAVVYVIIVGFSLDKDDRCILFDAGGSRRVVDHINAYLLAAPDAFIDRRTSPLFPVPIMTNGGKPTEGGHLILSEQEREDILKANPNASPLIRPYMMGKDFIDRKPRYCLWMVNASPSVIRSCPKVVERIEKVRAFRLSSTKESTRKKADAPMLFDEVRVSETDYVAIPKVSSGNRRYVPIEYLTADIIPGDKLFFIQGTTNYHFGIITSIVHMAWMRAVGGYFGPSYSYSNTIVYNNFPWPTPTDAQKEKIEQTAQAILDARALYPDSSLADLYDNLTMPPELRKAHRANDAAVMEAYGFRKDITEPEIVAELFKMYQELISKSK